MYFTELLLLPPALILKRLCAIWYSTQDPSAVDSSLSPPPPLLLASSFKYLKNMCCKMSLVHVTSDKQYVFMMLCILFFVFINIQKKDDVLVLILTPQDVSAERRVIHQHSTFENSQITWLYFSIVYLILIKELYTSWHINHYRNMKIGGLIHVFSTAHRDVY